MGGAPSFAGPVVNETSAMRSTTVFRCVALKAGVIAALPLEVYRRTTTGRERAVDNRMHSILHDRPNDLMSSFMWKEMIVANLMLAGNHYSVIEYDNAARVRNLLPVAPQIAVVERVKGRNRYTFTFSDGREMLDQDEVIHVPGIGFDGLKGLSPIAWAGKQPVGISLALDEFVGRMHANSARPSGTVTLPKNISPEGVRRMRAEIESLYNGMHATGKTMLLDNGAEWNTMQMSLQDAQTLESRRFQVADICRLFGLPPSMVGETDKQTSWGTGIREMKIGFQIFCLDPDLTRIEAELNRKLFTYPYYCEFNREALNAMDPVAQAEMFASSLMNAGMTPNEIRRKRNLPDDPNPVADELFVQAGTVPLSVAAQYGKPTQDQKDIAP